MKFNALFFFLFFVTATFSFSQTTYFIKYKNSVPIEEVHRKISEKRFSRQLVNRGTSLPEFDLNYLAKGLGRGDEVLGRIVKVTFDDQISESVFSTVITGDDEIEYFQQSVTYQINIIPNDSLVNQQWGLFKDSGF